MPAEFIIGAAIGAAAASTRVRQSVRQGLIYGVGGILLAYDKLSAGAQSVAKSARDAAVAARQGSASSTNGSSTTSPEPSPPLRPVTATPTEGTQS
jgi:hypothetical protein